jgi:hypothetical protein
VSRPTGEKANHWTSASRAVAAVTTIPKLGTAVCLVTDRDRS